MTTACHISLKNHHAYIHVAEDHQVYCFKYNDQRCEWNHFPDYDQLSDWLFAPMDPFQFQLVIAEE
jgi:hypothetical protein